jgi:hypothetical protein
VRVRDSRNELRGRAKFNLNKRKAELEGLLLMHYSLRLKLCFTAGRRRKCQCLGERSKMEEILIISYEAQVR